MGRPMLYAAAWCLFVSILVAIAYYVLNQPAPELITHYQLPTL